MLNKKFMFLIFSFIILFVVLITLPIYSASNEVPEGEAYSNSYYKVGNRIELPSEIDGNTFLIGKNVVIDKEINGDLFVIADTLEVNKMVYGSIFVVARNIIIHADINLDLYEVSMNLTITEEASIGRYANIISKEVNLKGAIVKDIHLFYNKNINFERTAKVYGDLNYYFNHESTIERGYIKGKINTYANEKGLLAYAKDVIVILIFSSIVWAILKFCTPLLAKDNPNISIKSLFLGFGIGILFFILIPLISLLLLYFRVAISIGIGILGIYILFISIAPVFFAIGMTQIVAKIFKMPKLSNHIIVVLGIMAGIWAITLIPGTIAWVFGMFSLLGMVCFFANLITKR